MNNQSNDQSQNNSSTDVVKSYTNSQSQQNSNFSNQAGKNYSQNTNNPKQKTVIGVFDSQADAETAVSTLRSQGFTNEEINIISKSNRQPNSGEKTSYDGDILNGGKPRSSDKVSFDDDITDGALTGGTLGGIGGLLIGAGAMVVPGIGPLLAAGPISAAIGGALAGGLAGGLIDWGIPSEASQRYVRQVEQNKILAIVRTSEQKVDEAAKIFRRYGANDVESHQ